MLAVVILSRPVCSSWQFTEYLTKRTELDYIFINFVNELTENDFSNL